MRIIGFVEGARHQSGGVGIPGVPAIHQSVAARGHEQLLVVGGKMMPGGRCLEVQEPENAFSRARYGQAGAFAIPSFTRWSFSLGIRHIEPLVRTCDFVTLHSLYSFPVLAGYLMARKHRKPYGIWLHGVLAPVQRRISQGRKRAYDAVVTRRILKQASVVIFTAQGERDETRGLDLRAPSIVVPHGIDVRPFAALPERGRFRRTYLGGSKARMVLYLGRLNTKKGLDVLVESAKAVVAAVPDAVIAIAGGSHPPAFGNRVAEWVSRCAVKDSIVMTGLADEKQKLEAFADADVFVLPSEAENFGFAMFEAMASRLPVVVSDTLNYAAAVRSAEAGLTPPRESGAFAAALISLLQDPERRRRMGENGRRLAGEYSWERCGQRIEAAVDSIIARRSFPPDLLPEYPA